MDQNVVYNPMDTLPQQEYKGDNYQEDEVIFLREEKPKSLSKKVAYSGFSCLSPRNDDINIIQSHVSNLKCYKL